VYVQVNNVDGLRKREDVITDACLYHLVPFVDLGCRVLSNLIPLLPMHINYLDVFIYLQIHSIPALHRYYWHLFDFPPLSLPQDARRRLTQCLLVTEKDPSWRTIVSAEAATLDILNQLYEKERVLVYVQPVATAGPPLPEGKVVVTPTTFIQQPYTDRFFL